MTKQSTIVVAVATLGRPDDVADLLEGLQKQTRMADKVILSVTDIEKDAPPEDKRFGAEVLIGSKGLCAQRNRILEKVGHDFDYLVFFDDDYIPTKTALEGVISFFDDNPGVVGITGHLLADGILGPGLTRDEAVALIDEFDAKPAPALTRKNDQRGLYGCNMAYRLSAIETERFDEKLPLYGWQEDVDFSNRLLAKGDLVETNAFVGVHRGTKRSRSPGKKLGYSQVANPLYLVKKGSMSRGRAYKLMIKNLIANHVKIMTPEPWVDRAGRANGNWHALFDVMRGKMDPEKINSL
jgi:GT2 family glycosyltransferase